MKDNQSTDQEPLSELPPEMMEGYVKGTLPGQMMRKVELYLAENPFEAEAIEGLRSTSGDFSGDLMELEDRLADRTRPQKTINTTFSWPLAAAVSLFVISGLIFYFFLPDAPKQSQIAINHDTVPPTPIEQRQADPTVKPQEKIEKGVASISSVEKEENIVVEVFDEEETEDILEKPESNFDLAEPSATGITNSTRVDNVGDLPSQPEDEGLVLTEQVSEFEESDAVDNRAKAKKETTRTAAPAAARDLGVSAVLPSVDAPSEIAEYLKKHANYPEAARANGIKGSVKVAFIVNTDGSLTDFNIMKKLGYGCDEEAVRVLSEGPVWEPATLNGFPVRSLGEIEIHFPVNN